MDSNKINNFNFSFHYDVSVITDIKFSQSKQDTKLYKAIATSLINCENLLNDLCVRDLVFY